MEPRICVFKVLIVSAENLWSADLASGKEPNKAAVSVHFPGQHGALPFTSDPVLPLPPPPASCQTPASPQPTDAIDSPAARNAKPKKPKGKADDHPPPPSPPVPVSFCFNVMSDYVKPSDWLLWHHLVSDPLTLSFLWTSPSGQTQTVVGNAAIDLSDLLLSEELSWEQECVIAPVAPDEAVKADAVKGKKEAAGHKGTNSKSKKTNAVEEVPPILLPGAIVKVQISLDMPILPDEERLGGLLLEFDKFCVKRVPPQYVDVSPDNATYALAFELPGFSGSSWWETPFSVKQDIKENLAVARIHGGKVSVRMSEQDAGGILSTSSGSDATPVEANEATDTAASTLLPADSGAGTEKEVPAPQNREAMLVWNNVAIRRFLPCVAAKELKESIWKRRSWHGELARYSDSDSLPFHRDHLTISIDLSEFLQEGTCEANICCTLNPYNPRKDLLNENGSTVNAQTVVSAGDANDSINPWQNCSSQLFFCVRTSRALEQVWKAPSKPALSLKEVITLRPKFATFEDRLKIAVDDFRVLVKAAAQSIMSLQENAVSNSESGFNSIALWSNRAEYNEKLKKRLSTELHETGTWNNLKEEMKGRILKVAAEKLKLANGEPKDNFLFYNSLYMQLMNVVKESIEELNARRREAFLNYSDGLETGASKRLHTLEHLRELADEYEADGDYRSANKCYVESLSQNNACPDLWFEYGLFCMRGKWKDCGKAEECFRESLNLKEDHVLSLLALACLMWHRSFCLQAEVILNTIIELHSREEAIAWVLLGQVYLLNNGQTDNAESCFTRAESLQKDVTSPILVSSLLRHPFSMSYLIQKSGISTNPYIDAAILLLDLHLPKEAQLILNMEHASFSCNIGVTFCLGSAKQLVGDYTEAEKLIKEVTVSYTTQAASIAAWALLGHIYFLSASFQQSIEAYEWILQHSSEGKNFTAFELLELGKSHLQEHQVDKAKRVFIDLCSVNPKSSSWLGAGVAFYEEGDMENAEAALAEGNVLDPWNFKIWAHLTLVSLRADQMPKAEFAFKQAMDCITFPPLLVQMAEAFLAKGNSRLAEVCLQKLCEGKNGDVIARLLWGTGSWEQKIGLAKQIAELVQNNPEIQQLTGEYDPLWAMLEHSGFQDIPTDTENPDTQLKELLALSCS